MNRLHAVILAGAFAMIASDVVGGAQTGTQQLTSPQPTTQQPQTQQPTTDRSATQQPAPRDSAATSASESAAFAQKAAMGGKNEVEMARMAAEKASNQEVKAYAEQLVRDHTDIESIMKVSSLWSLVFSVAGAPEGWN